MKYIRTKENHIFKIEENITDEEINSKKYVMLYQGEEIIEQADTIEELCDVYAIKVGNEMNIFVIDKISTNIAQNSELAYGAIWTDKGLIYVAKMNEKGELELL